MNDLCEGRVAIVTGAGGGIGREHALELAKRGAAVVVNDLGSGPDGSGSDRGPAETVAEEIRAAGGRAVASTHDVADWDQARELVDQAVDSFGTLDVLVNNAGILRDRTLASMSIEEWDDVIRVHLRGTFAPSRFAAEHWRHRAKESGEPVDGRLINTSSGSGLYGNFGQSNYGAAKAGIAALTLIGAKELAGYGVTVNAVAPAARTRLTAPLMPEGYGDNMPPAAIAPLVAWLASTQSSSVTGRVFDVVGGKIGICETWRIGPEASTDGLWSADELGDVIPELVAKAAPNVDMSGHVPAGDL